MPHPVLGPDSISLTFRASRAELTYTVETTTKCRADRSAHTSSWDYHGEAGKMMVLKWGRFGRFLACQRYPECRHTRPLPIGVPCPSAPAMPRLTTTLAMHCSIREQGGSMQTRSPAGWSGTAQSWVTVRSAIWRGCRYAA